MRAQEHCSLSVRTSCAKEKKKPSEGKEEGEEDGKKLIKCGLLGIALVNKEPLSGGQ